MIFGPFSVSTTSSLTSAGSSVAVLPLAGSLSLLTFSISSGTSSGSRLGSLQMAQSVEAWHQKSQIGNSLLSDTRTLLATGVMTDSRPRKGDLFWPVTSSRISGLLRAVKQALHTWYNKADAQINKQFCALTFANIIMHVWDYVNDRIDR